MKKIIVITCTFTVLYGKIFSQTTLQTVTDNGSTTTNAITITPTTTTTAPGTVAPALLLNPTYNRIGPATIITGFTATNAKAGTYNNRTPASVTGTGSGAVISVTVTGTNASVSVTSGGTGYNVGDALTIPVTDLGATGTGVYTMYVGNVNTTNTFHAQHAPLRINPTIGGAGYTGAMTPMFNLSGRLRDNSQGVATQLQFGFYFRTPQNSYWAFTANGNYLMGISSIIEMPVLSASTANINTLNVVNLTSANGRFITNGASNAAFVDNTTKYIGQNTNTGSSFISNQTIVSGAVSSVVITNAGSGYTPGTYGNLVATGGTGTGLQFTVTVGAAGTVTATAAGSNSSNFGSGYSPGDIVTVPIPGGSGFKATVVLRTGQHFAALANYSTFRSKTADNFYSVRSMPTIVQEEGATGNVYGFYHNPTLSPLKGNHIAFQNTTGDVFLGTTSGNVGIGTSNPQAKLAVQGTLLAQRVKVSVNPAEWPDYVFDSSYRLLPLEEVEAFIQQKRHLPEVPSAATVEEEGLDLGNNQQLLLKKIEELTLYMIEQHKELKAQNERIKTLEASRKNKPAQ